MLIKSFSKINLSLTVGKKLKKRKLHQIQSFFFLTNIQDTIRIHKSRAKKDTIVFKGKFSKNINKRDNSIKDTLKILRKEKIISNYYSLSINKKIPIFSGMGGGTSNSAAILKYFIKGKIKKNLMNILQKKIGSDLRLFFSKQGFLTNLDQVINFKKKHKLNLIIIYPNIRCSTREVYSKVFKYSMMSKPIINNLIKKNKFINYMNKEKNDLQSIVEKKYPAIQRLITKINSLDGCHFSRMTGSGSACYGMFQSQKLAKLGIKKIKKKFPKYWATVTKTI